MNPKNYLIKRFLLRTIYVLFLSTLAGITPVLALTGTVTSTVTLSDNSPEIGDVITATIDVDMSGVTSSDLLGSYTGTLDWDETILEYQSYTGAPPANFTGVVNTSSTSSGHITFNAANASGGAGDIIVLSVTFNVIGEGFSVLDLEYSAMSAAGTFANLLAVLTVNDGSVTSTDPTISTLGLDGSSSSATLASGSSLSFVHTTGSSTDRLMLVGISWNCGTANRTVSSVTFTPDGGSAVALTEVITQLAYNTSNPRYSAIYKLINPSNGQLGTVTITFSGSVSNGIMAGAANFAGVDQITPLGIPGGANGTSSSSPNITLSGLNGNELVFDNVFLGAGASTSTLTVGPDQTQLWNPDYIANLRATASIEQAISSSVSMSWTASTPNYWAIAAVPINPATTGPTHTLIMAVSPAAGGTTSPLVGGPYTYAENAVVPIVATPAVGYEFSHWTPDDTPGDPIADPYTASTTVTMNDDYAVTAHFAPLTYTLTVNTVGNGTVIKDPDIAGPYNYGTIVEMTAEAEPGWVFTGWSGDLVSSDNPASITMIGDRTVTATFVQEFTLNVGNDGNGSVTLDPAGGTYVTGTEVTLIPVPNSGFKFDTWTGDDAGDISGSGGVYTIVMDGNKSVSAAFAETTLYADGSSVATADDVSSIDISHTTGGGENRLMLVGISWNCGSDDRIISSVTFTPDGESATLMEEVITSAASSTTAPRYSAIYSLLSPPKERAGIITITFSGSVASGIVAGAVNFAGVNQATPLGISNGATASSSSFPTVTLDGLNGDELVFDNVFQGASGETQTLTPDAEQTQLWNSWIANNRAAASVKETTGSSVETGWTAASNSVWVISAVAINPAPSITTYTLTYTAGTGGTISGTSPQTVNYGDDGTAVEAVPGTGYHFVDWSDGSIANPRTDENVMEDISVTANFAINTFTLTYTAGTGGTISGTSPQTVNYGDDGTAVEAVPGTGYHFVDWSDGSIANPRTDENVMEDVSVTANFAITPYCRYREQ
ncbi:MAG: InlB B-repeat-containing protein [Draconibacterium sp.]